MSSTGKDLEQPRSKMLYISREQRIELLIPVVAVFLALLLGALLVILSDKARLKHTVPF